MVSTEELVLDALAVVAAVLYFTVARIQSKRKVSGSARSALHGFVFWWAGLGVVALSGVAIGLAGGLEDLGVMGVRLTVYPLFGLIFIMLAGLVHYLLYLYTGRRNSIYIASAFYALMFLFLVWLLEAHTPHTVPGHGGEETGFHLHDDPSPVASAILSLGLLVPPLASAIAYALLFFRTPDRTARYRIVMVSGGFVLWFTYSLLSSLIGLAAGVEEESFASEVAGQLLGVLAAVMVLLAYKPPRSLQRRFGLRAVGDERPKGSPFEHPPRVQGPLAAAPRRVVD